MSPSLTSSMNPCAATTSSAWRKSAARTNMRPESNSGRCSYRHSTARLRIPFMTKLIALAAPIVLCLPIEADAAELKILPPQATLTGPHARQRLLVLAEEDGKVVGDLTA